MAKKRYVNSDPTAWIAIGWVDKEAARDEVHRQAEDRERAKKSVEKKKQKK